MEVKPTLLDRIREAQKGDSEMEELKDNMSKGKTEGFCEDEQGTLWSETHSNYVCVEPVETRPQIASTVEKKTLFDFLPLLVEHPESAEPAPSHCLA
jgi:hypothetical protein